MTRPSIPHVGFVAPSGTGKTTLVLKLVAALRALGLRIGYLKQAHEQFDIDVPGKDSYQVREAGAAQTLVASCKRWAFMGEDPRPGGEPPLDELLARFDRAKVDLVLVEGFNHCRYPKVEVFRSTLAEAPKYLGSPDIIAVASDTPLAGEDHPKVLPIDDPEAIARFIQGRLERGELTGVDHRVEIIRYYQWLRSYHYNDSHSGNASARVGDRFWITPFGAAADTLEPDDLISAPMDGDTPKGVSLDTQLHQLVYRSQPGARAILHSHGAYAVAVSLAGQDFTPLDFEGRSQFGAVPVLNVDDERYFENAPERVAEALVEHKVAILAGHGVYAWGKNLDEAYRWTCTLELSAKTYVLAKQAASY